MQNHTFNASRRAWMRRSSLSLAGALGTGSLANLVLPAGTAEAADYRALVCIFLQGGNDGTNTIVPLDATRFGQYTGVRKALALPQASILPLGASGYGLHPALSALMPTWAEGRLAPVFNVGPLFAPLTKDTFKAAAPNSDLIPANLFSHSDQQNEWQTSSTSPFTRTGWGGRGSEVLATANPVIAVGGNGRFGLSSRVSALSLPEPGELFGAHELGNEPWRATWAPTAARAAALRAMYNQTETHQIADAHVRLQRDAFAVSDRLASIVKAQPWTSAAYAAIDNAFAPITSGGRVVTGLGRQLYQVAKLIASRGTVGGTRQIFYAQLDGFDTHSSQAYASSPTTGAHASLLKELGDALAAFQLAMKNLGLADAVTSFTQSEFGRTFSPNSSLGTDHGWGNHQLVLGGGVRGNTTYGRYPSLVLGGQDDVGINTWDLQGRWIPTTSVDQYAATLLAWLGADGTQLDSVFPNLRNFGTARNLGFV